MDTKLDLATIRQQIDALDGEMRELLRARAELVTQVAASKAQSDDGTALRPAREAQQMADLMAWQSAHAPALPLAGLIAIWREIIGMAIYQQGGLTVFATPDSMDAARAHFGASLTYELCADVQAALSSTARAIGVVDVAHAEAPMGDARVFARLPVIGDITALCYGIIALEEDDMAVTLVQRSAPVDGDAVIYEAENYVLVETRTPDDKDVVWGRYRRLGDTP